MVLLVTDGQSNEFRHLTIPKADALKATGVEIFVVAVGRYIPGIDEMVKVASFPPDKHVFRVNSNSALWEAVKLAIKEVNPGKYSVLSGEYDPPCQFCVQNALYLARAIIRKLRFNLYILVF